MESLTFGTPLEERVTGSGKSEIILKAWIGKFSHKGNSYR
jgi:hypothetical protein